MVNNGFIIYTEYKEKTKRLSDEQLGKLLRCLFDYKADADEPEFEDIAIATAFDFIKADIDRQNDNYEKKVSAGKKGGEAKAANAKVLEQNVAEPSTAKQDVAESIKSSKTDNYNYNYNNNLKEKEIKEKEKRFTPPSVEDVKAYCVERDNGIDPEQFVNFYASKGWKVGKQPMKDWRACVRTWEQRNRDKPTPKPNSFTNIMTHDYDFDELERKLLGVG